MRMRFISYVVAALVLVAGRIEGAGAETFGVAPSLTKATPITQVLAKPSEFEGKTVRVEGVVKAVCTEMGCWMALASSDAPTGPTVMLKVDDGVIVFPVSAKGKRATAQGVVERVGAGDAEGQEAAAEHARHEGRTAEKSTAAQWRIKATGAVVY